MTLTTLIPAWWLIVAFLLGMAVPPFLRALVDWGDAAVLDDLQERQDDEVDP